ncbi:hypothetical protein JL722_1359 [Aureococcus anophagefferens]|nr:hypothetical protein JL722_1359 [Aureococcus anophagefferens]
METLRSAAVASYVPKSVTNLCPSGAQVANTTGISYFKPEEAAPQEPGKFGSKNTRTGGYIDASLDPTQVDTSVGAKGLASVKGRAQVAANQQKKAATKAYKDTKKDAQKTVTGAVDGAKSTVSTAGDKAITAGMKQMGFVKKKSKKV